MNETPPTNPIVLTAEQQSAVDAITKWATSHAAMLNPTFSLGGYAGTGKTTVIRTLKATLPSVKVAAFTGKAVDVLRRKGVDAQTIHSLIYDVYEEDHEIHFTLKSHLNDTRLIIVDEASMVSRDLYDDLRSFHIPILFVGDPGQLEPIGDNPNLMASCDIVLDKIHRQAEASPIIKLAQLIRFSGQVVAPNPPTPDCIVKGKRGTQLADLVAADQVICATNAARISLNMQIRDYKHLPAQTICPGEKLICLKNNRSLGIFNGQIIFVERIKKALTDSFLCEVSDGLGHTKELDIWRSPFTSNIEINSKTRIPKGSAYCDYAYAITCHKSQGSEWDYVIVCDQWMPPKVWDMKRWRYTAVTRAAKKLLYLL
jgi:exodeoxyribonuclease-5